MEQRKQLRKLLSSPEVLVVPGAYDCVTARLVEAHGYPVVSVSGAAVTASVLGKPDLGLITMTEMLSQVRNIVRAVSIPVMVDCETGYGGPLNVMRTVQEFEAAGVASLFLEDQAAARRCGHFRNKRVVSTQDMVTKIRAAVRARSDPDMIIMARTDAREEHGIEEAIARAKAYAGAGADSLFVEAPHTRAELERVGRELSGLGLPLKVNLAEGGKTPLIAADELSAMGFKVVNLSGSLQKVAIKAMGHFLAELQVSGRVDLHYPDKMVSLEERSALLGLDAFYELEQALLR